MLKVEKLLKGSLTGRHKREGEARKAQKEVLSPVPQILVPFFPLSPGELYPCRLFQSQHLIITRISENIPATSEDL